MQKKEQTNANCHRFCDVWGAIWLHMRQIACVRWIVQSSPLMKRLLWDISDRYKRYEVVWWDGQCRWWCKSVQKCGRRRVGASLPWYRPRNTPRGVPASLPRHPHHTLDQGGNQKTCYKDRRNQTYWTVPYPPAQEIRTSFVEITRNGILLKHILELRTVDPKANRDLKMLSQCILPFFKLT